MSQLPLMIWSVWRDRTFRCICREVARLKRNPLWDLPPWDERWIQTKSSASQQQRTSFIPTLFPPIWPFVEYACNHVHSRHVSTAVRYMVKENLSMTKTYRTFLLSAGLSFLLRRRASRIQCHDRCMTVVISTATGTDMSFRKRIQNYRWNLIHRFAQFTLAPISSSKFARSSITNDANGILPIFWHRCRNRRLLLKITGHEPSLTGLSRLPVG